MDELTSVESPASATTPLDGGTTSQTSPTPQQDAAAPTSSAASTTAASTGPVNLFESPQFRQVQAQWSRQIDAAQRAAQEAQQRANEIAMSQMDDLERANYQAQMAQAEAQQYRQYLEEQQLMARRQQTIADTAREFNVPVEVIQDAETPADMFRKALAHLKTEAQRSAEVRAQGIRERQDANQVDLGSGGISDGLSALMQKALKNKDAASLYRAIN